MKNFTLAQEYFQIDEPTLLILCEEGEEEYDKKVLKKSRIRLKIYLYRDLRMFMNFIYCYYNMDMTVKGREQGNVN